jgi:CDP-paratose 2-epimerase
VKLIKGDVRDFEVVKAAAKDADIMIHAAAQVAVTTSLIDPRTDFEVNVLGTLNILEAARIAKTDPVLMFTSTNKVYGSNVNEIPVSKEAKRYSFADGSTKKGIPEDFPVDLCEHTPYGCSKLAADLYVQDYARIYGLKTGVFRMSCIYGERQFGNEEQGWVMWFVIATMVGKPITIYGDGKQVRDVLYISDLVEAYDTLVKSGLKGEIFNIGGGPENTLSLLELLDMLEELTGKRTRISFSDWRRGDQEVYVSDISKVKKKLGWSPKVSPRDGIEKLVGWVQRNSEFF